MRAHTDEEQSTHQNHSNLKKDMVLLVWLYMAVQAAGIPFWDESHDFEGWWLGDYVNMKAQAPEGERT